MKNIFLCVSLVLIVSFCYAQQNKNKSSPDSVLQSVTGKMDNIPADSIMNTSFVSANGERFLRFELIIDKTMQEVWNAFATEEGMKTWMSPVAQLDFRIGGTAYTNYDKKAKIGDKGTISLGIIHYIPNELLTYKIILNDVFPEKCRSEDDNLQEVIQFKSMGDNKSKIISTMIGWGKGKEWNQTYSFFEEGNKWSYAQLAKRFKSGTIEWK